MGEDSSGFAMAYDGRDVCWRKEVGGDAYLSPSQACSLSYNEGIV